MITRLLEVLAAVDPEPTAEELADALWLARHLPAPAAGPGDQASRRQVQPGGVTSAVTPSHGRRNAAPGEPLTRRSLTPRAEAGSPGAGAGTAPRAALGLPPGQDFLANRGGTPIRAPAVPALPGALALARALRPLNRTVPSYHEFLLDEEATAGRVADAGLWVPVRRPAPSRWLDLALVVDDSASMRVWQRSADELRRLLERQGAFRDVRVWRLNSDEATTGQPALRNESPSVGAGHSPLELVDPVGRRVILVLSDCIGAGWTSGAVSGLIERWAAAGPVAIVQPLPQRLWNRCGPTFVPVRLRGSRPGLPNDRLDVSVRPGVIDPPSGSAGAPVPVMELAARWLAPWAALVAGTEGGWINAMALFTGLPPARPPADAQEPTENGATLSPLERVLRFRMTASPTAFELAGYLAAAPLSLPVMRLVQHVMLPASQPAHLAEVFCSSLLRRVEPAVAGGHPDDIQYDFHDQVRELLLTSRPRTEALRVLTRVSDFVSARVGSSLDFRALLVDPSDKALESLRHHRPLALVACSVLRSLGGRYAENAERLRAGLDSDVAEHLDDAEAIPTRVEALAGVPSRPLDHAVHRSRTSGGTMSVPSPQTVADQDRRPGGPPAVWGDVPLRNPNFTGREALLNDLRNRLAASVTAVLPHALHGLGGVGKTQLATEYAYRFASEYDLVWWIPAEQLALVRASLAALAPHLGHGDSNVAEALPVVLDALRRGHPYRRWLLVFDNAEDPEELAPLLPHGSGHVLVTSRNRGWSSTAEILEVDVFSRAESIVFLRQRGELPPQASDRLAAKLGDLPLALEQAGAWHAETGMSIDEYLQLFDERMLQLLSESPPSGYPLPVAAAWSLAFERLRGRTPAAVQLLELCAFFSSEPISRNLLSFGRFLTLPEPLDAAMGDPILLGRAIREIGRYALARIDHTRDSLQIHRLVQAVLREELTPTQRAATQRQARALLAAANPGRPDEPATWERYADMWPHIEPSGALEGDEGDVQQLVLDQIDCLQRRGDYESGRDLGETVVQHWREILGEDAPQTLAAARRLAGPLRSLGLYRASRALNEDTLERLRRVLGEDHEETLRVSNSVGADLRALGEFTAARELDADTLARHKRIFGEDHPLTLSTANNLAVSLRLVGEFQGARALDEETLERRRRVLGEDHPYTLFSANNLARDLRECGEYAASRAMQEHTLARYRLRLGHNHPDTLRAAKNLAVSLRKAGAYAAARELAEENLERYRQRFGEDHPDTLAAGTNLSNDRRLTGDLEGARAVGEDTLARYRRVLDEDHPYTLACATNLAIILRAAGRAAEARAMDENSLTGFRRVLGDDHYFTLACASSLANDRNACQEPAAACELHQDTLDRYRRVLGEDHPYTLACAVNLAIDLRVAGDEAQAQALAEDSVARYLRVLGDEHPDTAAAIAGRTIECDIEPPPT